MGGSGKIAGGVMALLLGGSCAAALQAGDTAPATTMRIVVLADPQVKSPDDIDFLRRDVMATVRAGETPTLGLVLGDVVDDEPGLFPGVVDVLGDAWPWLYAPGNHDVDPGSVADADSLDRFTGALGREPQTWRGDLATVVMLDDVIVRPDPGIAYIGGFREDQFAFLEGFLATVPMDRLLVVGVHIPLFEAPGRDTFRDADRERLFALLGDFPHVLLLSGHSHTQRHHFHDASTGWHGQVPLHEYNVGAASGAFWSGVKDAAGVPDSTMADGTPNGYAVLRPERGVGYSLDWRPARVHADDPLINEAMALHAPKVLRQGSWPGQAVHANVFMGMDDTRVEYRIDSGDWQPMQHVFAPDPRVVAENVHDDEAGTLRAYDRAPQAVPSTHLWRGTLPTDLPVGEHRVEVRAFDRWQGERRARTSYELVLWEPAARRRCR